MMKRVLILLSALLAAASIQAATTEPYTKALITMTNLANFVPGSSIDWNGDTRRATNGAPADLSKWVHITNSIVNQVTNWMRHFNEYAPSGSEGVWTNGCTPTNFYLVGMPGQAVTVTLSTGSGNWGFVTYETNYWTNTFPVYMPFTLEQNLTRSNIMSDLLAALNAYPTNIANPLSAWLAEVAGRTNAQHLRNKVIGDSSTSNTVHNGTFGVVSNGWLFNTAVSNSMIKGGTLTSNATLAQVKMAEGPDRLGFDGSAGTNWLQTSETGQPMLLTPGGLTTTNSSPSLADIINYVSMLRLFPRYTVGATNFWGSRNEWTNISDNLIFWYGFRASNGVVMITPLFRQATNWGPLRFRGTNFTTGAEFTKDIVMIGDGVRIGGAAGDSDGNFGAGYNIYLSTDSSAPIMGIGRGLIVTNGGKFAMGFDGIQASNTGAYSFFGTATEDNEFRIGDGQSFVRFKPPIKNLTTMANGSNIFRGDISFPMYANTTVATGDNSDVDFGTNTLVALTGPGGDYRISSFRGPRDGRLVFIYFGANYNATILNDSGIGSPVNENKILTLSGADQTSSGNAVGLTFYHPTLQRWIFAWLNRGSGAGSAGVNFDTNSFNVNGGMVTVSSNMVTTGIVHRAQARLDANIEGLMWNDATQRAVRIYQSGTTQALSSTLIVLTNSVSVANTTTETSFFPLGSCIGNTNLSTTFWAPGKQVRITVSGQWQASGAVGKTFRVRIGTAAPVALLYTPAGAAGPGVRFTFTATLTCRATGSSGSVVNEARAEMFTTTAMPASPNYSVSASSSTTAINTTVAHGIDVTVQHASASATDTLTAVQATIEVLN